MSDFKKGAKVTFTPGRATTKVTAEVIGHKPATGGRGGGAYLITKGTDGVERMVRPGACQLAA